LTQLLKDRFGGAARADKYRLELRSRARKPGESLENLHQDIRRYMALVFCDVEQKAREILACDYFINALSEFTLKIRERNSKTLDAALHIALQIEVWMKDTARQEPKYKEEPKRPSQNIRGCETVTHNSETKQLMEVQRI